MKNDKIKIARIVTVPFTFISLLGLLDYLNQDERFEVHIICGVDPFETILKNRYPHFIFHSVHIPRKIHFLNDIKAFLKLYYILKNEKFSIVHSHTPKAGMLSSIAGWLARVPVRIHTFTGQVWVDYTGGKRSFFKAIDEFICKLNTVNYVDSLSQKEYLLKNGVGTFEKLIVLHKGSIAGINIDKFDPEKNKQKSKELKAQIFPNFQGKVILYLGRINNDKGLKELALAFLNLRERFDLKLLMVGPEEVLNPELAELILKLRQDIDVHFIGFVSDPEDYYAVADIYCLPSYREGCPASVLEASAMEKPVIASNIYGISDIVIDGETAYLFEPRNAQDLISKFEILLQNEELCHSLGSRGRKFVCENFSEKKLTELMTNEYLKLSGS